MKELSLEIFVNKNCKTTDAYLRENFCKYYSNDMGNISDLRLYHDYSARHVMDKAQLVLSICANRIYGSYSGTQLYNVEFFTEKELRKDPVFSKTLDLINERIKEINKKYRKNHKPVKINLGMGMFQSFRWNKQNKKDKNGNYVWNKAKDAVPEPEWRKLMRGKRFCWVGEEAVFHDPLLWNPNPNDLVKLVFSPRYSLYVYDENEMEIK